MRLPCPAPVRDALKDGSAIEMRLGHLLPGQQASVDTAYQAALAGVPEGSAKANGVRLGEQCASQVR